jgi:hypothetical protein
MDATIFDKTGNRSSISSDLVFGDDEANVPSFGDQLILPRQSQPLSNVSMVSLASLHSPMKERRRHYDQCKSNPCMALTIYLRS